MPGAHDRTWYGCPYRRRSEALLAWTHQARLIQNILDARTYRRILYLLLALPLGVAEFAFLVTAISFGFGTAVTLIGIPVLIGTVFAWRWLAELERRLIGRLVGIEIPSPYRPDPPGRRWWRRFTARLADPATWKDLAFLLLQLPLGILAFTVTVTVLGVGLGSVAPAVLLGAARRRLVGWIQRGHARRGDRARCRSAR